MNELAIPEQSDALQVYGDANLARFEQWARHADTAVHMAEIVVNTAMCPRAYRGKPHEAAAAMLAGGEMGLSPMASLRAFDDINGTPAPKAITLRAVVQARGHDLEVLEADAQHAIVEGRRKGSDRWQRLEWTIERATQAGYPAKNPRWKADPTAQLVARATAEMARWLDSAAIMGMPYSSEEISDSTGLDAAPVTRRVTAADIVGAAVEHAQQPTIDAIDVPEALARIKHASDQAELDHIKVRCHAGGIRGGAVADAWIRRSAELAGTVLDPEELIPELGTTA